MSVIIGIDVSSAQGQPDWAAIVASGQAFAWTKATEGTGYINPDFVYNWQNIKANGMIRGAYHFARPDVNTPQAEVDYFLSVVGELQPTDLIALDLETGSGDLSAWCHSWLTYCESKVGFKPLLYSGTWFLAPHGCLYHPELANYPLWLSGYQANMPSVPPSWQMINMWQFTDKAIVPGVAGRVDQSYFLGTLDELHSYGKQMNEPTLLNKTVADNLVTILSVIGDTTYNTDGTAADMNSAMPGQAVSRVVFLRELVQQAKGLLGA